MHEAGMRRRRKVTLTHARHTNKMPLITPPLSTGKQTNKAKHTRVGKEEEGVAVRRRGGMARKADEGRERGQAACQTHTPEAPALGPVGRRGHHTTDA